MARVGYFKQRKNRRKQRRRLTRTLIHELERYTPRRFDVSNCSVFWGRVFISFYSTCPDSSTDPRWDTLLHELKGLRLLNQLLNRSPYWHIKPDHY